MNLSTKEDTTQCSESLIDNNSTFESMGLDPRILRSIKKLGFKNPTLVQSSSIPLALRGKDILAKARTGSGKTAAYSIPIIQKILMAKEKTNIKGVKAIVLVPTRELCEQVKTHFVQLCSSASHLVSIIQVGSDKSIEEISGLLRDIPDVIISTPTRLVKLLELKSIQIQSTLEMLVIDEADLVLSFGYREDINTIKTYLPKVCQCFLMSATLTSQVEELKKLVLHTPAILKLEEDQVHQSNLTEYSIKCSEFDKYLLMFSLLRLKLMQGKILFFVNDTDSCYKLKLFLERFHIKSAVLNSELPVNSRHDIILQFNKGLFDYLIATDESFKAEEGDDDEDDENNISVKEEEEDDDEDENNISVKEEEEDEDERGTFVKAPKKTQYTDDEYGVARGIDFRNVDIVVNFDFPRTVKNYIHRIGRTARGSSKGIALSFVTHNNEDLLAKVQKKRNETGFNLRPFEFKMNAIEGFRYRVEDVLATVSKTAIKEARKAELKKEILNSEKLKQHFAENPQDLLALNHDTTLIKKKVRQHLRTIPEYLLPTQFKNANVDNTKLKVIPSGNKRKFDENNQSNPNNNNNHPRKRKDILKSLSTTKKQLTPEQIEFEKKVKAVKKLNIKTGNIAKDGSFQSYKQDKNMENKNYYKNKVTKKNRIDLIKEKF
eukprot:gene4316-5402_t